MENVTLSKFDRAFAGLQGGNNLPTKTTTIEQVEPITGAAESFMVQTIRTESGDFVVLKYMDNEGTKRLIIPPAATNCMARQRDALNKRSRRIASRNAMRERILNGYKPSFKPKR